VQHIRSRLEICWIWKSVEAKISLHCGRLVGQAVSSRERQYELGTSVSTEGFPLDDVRRGD